MSKQSDKHLVWLDLEMTGLDPEKDTIIEIATVITDSNLEVIAEGPVFAIHHSNETLAIMDKWNVHHHTKSGLIDRVRQSTVSMLEAEQKTLEFIATYVYKGHSPLCGNSIGHDRRFLYKYMPNLVSHLHYRNIDISTLKELAKRWDPVLAKSFNKESKHIAMDDIMDSIEELRFYRQHFLKESIDVPRS